MFETALSHQNIPWAIVFCLGVAIVILVAFIVDIVRHPPAPFDR